MSVKYLHSHEYPVIVTDHMLTMHEIKIKPVNVLHTCIHHLWNALTRGYEAKELDVLQWISAYVILVTNIDIT